MPLPAQQKLRKTLPDHAAAAEVEAEEAVEVTEVEMEVAIEVEAEVETEAAMAVTEGETVVTEVEMAATEEEIGEAIEVETEEVTEVAIEVVVAVTEVDEVDEVAEAVIGEEDVEDMAEDGVVVVGAAMEVVGTTCSPTVTLTMTLVVGLYRENQAKNTTVLVPFEDSESIHLHNVLFGRKCFRRK
jgi:hypothetical protein